MHLSSSRRFVNFAFFQNLYKNGDQENGKSKTCKEIFETYQQNLNVLKCVFPLVVEGQKGQE